MTKQEFDKLTAITEQLIAMAGELADDGDTVEYSNRLVKLAVDCGILALSNGKDSEQVIAGKLHTAMTT